MPPPSVFSREEELPFLRVVAGRKEGSLPRIMCFSFTTWRGSPGIRETEGASVAIFSQRANNVKFSEYFEPVFTAQRAAVNHFTIIIRFKTRELDNSLLINPADST